MFGFKHVLIAGLLTQEKSFVDVLENSQEDIYVGVLL